jgi:hypothetical protein
MQLEIHYVCMHSKSYESRKAKMTYNLGRRLVHQLDGKKKLGHVDST